MRKKQEKNPKNKGMIILIVILVIAFLFSFVKDFFTKDSGIKSKSSNSSGYIAELYIEGTIQTQNEQYNQQWLLDTIDELKIGWFETKHKKAKSQKSDDRFK